MDSEVTGQVILSAKVVYAAFAASLSFIGVLLVSQKNQYKERLQERADDTEKLLNALNGNTNAVERLTDKLSGAS